MGKNNNNKQYNKNTDYGKKIGDGEIDHRTVYRKKDGKFDKSQNKGQSSAFAKLNDFSWYNAFPEDINNAGGVRFTQAAGVPVDMRGYNDTYTTPGICRIGITTCPGIALDKESPINNALAKIYSANRKQNANNIPYDPADVGMYMLGVMDAHKLIAYCMRLYGLLNTYNASNMYWPRRVFESMGLDFESFQKDPTGLRDLINQMIRAINSRALPASYSIIKRWIWMFSNIFTDSSNYKAQMYYYDIDTIYKYEPFASSTGGYLRAEAKTWNTLEELRTEALDMISRLVEDPDIRMISGDFMHVFDENMLLKWEPIDINYAITPLHNPEILSQIENATIAPAYFHEECLGFYPYTNMDVEANALSIMQKDGYLVYQPDCAYVGLDHDIPSLSVINNQHMDNPGVPEITVSTRLSALWKYTGTDHTQLDTCGSEWISSASIWVLTGPLNARTLVEFPLSTHRQFSGDVDFGTLQNLMHRSVFDWAPMALYYETGSHPTIFGDLDNWITLDYNTITRLHRVCLWSEWANPDLGQFK